MAASKHKRRSAISLLELITVVAIVGMILALVLHAIEASRESARSSECQNHLRQIALAALQYESSRAHLPPGILGVAEAFTFEENRYEPESRFFWKRYQYTSSLAIVLPFIGRDDLAQRYASIAFDVRRTLDDLTDANGQQRYQWFGEIPGFSSVAKTPIDLFRCPSDVIRSDHIEIMMGGYQPVVRSGVDSDAVSWQNLVHLMPLHYAMTNYAGCAGAHSGGIHPDPQRRRFGGLMSTRDRIRLSNCSDGASHTILYGEVLGGVDAGRRRIAVSWLTGALARGRGSVPWQEDSTKSLFGNGFHSFFYGFASVHSAAVNFAFGDGHLRHLSRETDWRVVYSLCGKADSELSTGR